MINRFTVNGVTYNAKPFNFKMLVDLNKFGIKTTEIQKMDMALLNAYFAICAEVDEDEAAEIIEEHVINGGDFDDITTSMTKEMEESDFFRALANKAKAGEGTNHPQGREESEAEKPKRGRKPSEA